ncbi:hypothetical protein EPUL_004965, partial [Erysiphe pulchra]
MLPSLSTFTKFEDTQRTTGQPLRKYASLEHNEQLPSIFELVPELSEGSPKDYHHPSWHDSYGLRNYQVMNTCTALNSSINSSSKRRRLSIDDEEEMRKSRELMDFRLRDAHPSSVQWGYFQHNYAPTPTPDPSPSSRRSSTFSLTETWTVSPPSNRYTTDLSSPFSRTYTATPRVLNQFSNEASGQNTAIREHSHFPGDSGPGIYVENICHFNNDDSAGARDKENKPRKRRGNLPKDTTDKLRNWFLNHLEHPYPTEDEKQQLMDSTGLQMSALDQISNWYINARRRQLPAITANARAEAEARRHIQNSNNCQG